MSTDQSITIFTVYVDRLYATNLFELHVIHMSAPADHVIYLNF